MAVKPILGIAAAARVEEVRGVHWLFRGLQSWCWSMQAIVWTEASGSQKVTFVAPLSLGFGIENSTWALKKGSSTGAR